MGVAWSLKPILPDAFYHISMAQEYALSNIFSAVSDMLRGSAGAFRPKGGKVVFKAETDFIRWGSGLCSS